MNCQAGDQPTWSSALTDSQRLSMVFELIQKTSLSEVRFLIDVLKSREADLTLSRATLPISITGSPAPDVKMAPRSSNIPPIAAGTRPGYTRQATISEDPNRRRDLSCTPWRVFPCSLPTNTTILKPRQSSPTSQISITPPTRSASTSSPNSPYQKHVSNSANDTLSTVQLNLVRLTLTPEYSPPLTLPKRAPPRKRKIPRYPIDSNEASAIVNWLHTLRLHKYAPNLTGLTPRELLELDEAELVRRGVDTIGARNKLLVAFQEAKKSLGMLGKS